MAEAETIALSKRCTCCGEEKPATSEFFQRQDRGLLGLRSQCKPCRAAVSSRYRKSEQGVAKRREREEKDRISGAAKRRRRAWQKNNPDRHRRIRAAIRARKKDDNRERERRWRKANPEKVRAKQRRADAKLQQNPAHVLKKRVKARLRAMLKGDWTGRTEEILGYTKEQLREHISRQFTAGMDWARLMKGEIHIDHIIPVSRFNITSVDCPDFKACWALSNLRPMWALDNQRKQAKVLTLI